MTAVGEREIRTQRRVVGFFQGALGYDYLDWQDRPDNRNVEEELLEDWLWYRRQLRDRLPPLLAKWEPRVGERVADVRIRKMKTRWGTCNPEARCIWLNLELAKKLPQASNMSSCMRWSTCSNAPTASGSGA